MHQSLQGHCRRRQPSLSLCRRGGERNPTAVSVEHFAPGPFDRGNSGPYWEDYSGRFFARAAGAEGLDTNVVIQWFYPLQPGFFYDFNGDGQPDASVGTEIAWLDRRAAGILLSPNQSAGTLGRPINVTYDIRWPGVATLQIGETLLNTKNGLPGVKNMARVQIIYDDLTPAWDSSASNAPLATLARLYDPLSTRTLQLLGTESIPSAIKRQNIAGSEIFTDLPYVIRSRLKYDPINRWLLFRGILDESYAGEPLLLPNVLSSRERQRIENLVPGDSNWAALVKKLYDLTRNPNRVVWTRTALGTKRYASASLRNTLTGTGQRMRRRRPTWSAR